jgi:tetratricopeptide (TPR) repeat protein
MNGLAKRILSLDAIVGMILVLGTLALFAPCLLNEFVNYDDEQYVTMNAHVQEGLRPSSLWWTLTATEAANWHPLTWISLEFDYQLYRGNPVGFHLTNVVIHSINVMLVYVLLKTMTGATWPSALTAALFGCHPLRVESVAWVAERKDVLSALFWLWTSLAYVHYVKRPVPGRYLIVVVLFALGLLSKPMLVSLPCALLLLDYWPLARMSMPIRWHHASWLLLEKLPLAAMAAASSVVTLFAQRHAGAIDALPNLPLGVRFENAAGSYVAYLEKMIWPDNLAAFYAHPGGHLPFVQVIGSILLLGGITGSSIALARRAPYFLVGWLWYLGTLVPVIGIVQVGLQGMADRYTYIPGIGIAVALCFGLRDVAVRLRLPVFVSAGTAALLIGSCCIVTLAQIRYWHDSISLWRRALDVAGPSWKAENNYATALESRGLWKEASMHYQAAIRLDPTKADPYFNMGVGLGRRRQPREAIPYFQEAIARRPNWAEAHNSLGSALLESGSRQEAIEEFERAVKLAPDYALGHYNLGYALLRKGDFAQAASHLQKALDFTPRFSEAWDNLGIVFCLQGEYVKAAERFEQAIRLGPGVAKYRFDLAHAKRALSQESDFHRLALEGLVRDRHWPDGACQTAWTWATHPSAQVRSGALALRLAQQACEVTPAPPARFLDTLAAAYAEMGQFDQALQTLRQAMAASAQDKSIPLTALVAQRHLYENRQPFRDNTSPDVLGQGARPSR